MFPSLYFTLSSSVYFLLFVLFLFCLFSFSFVCSLSLLFLFLFCLFSFFLFLLFFVLFCLFSFSEPSPPLFKMPLFNFKILPQFTTKPVFFHSRCNPAYILHPSYFFFIICFFRSHLYLNNSHLIQSQDFPCCFERFVINKWREFFMKQLVSVLLVRVIN